VCPACQRFFKTLRGMQSHLSSARTCSWYMKGKLRELNTNLEDEDFDLSGLESVTDSFHFIPAIPIQPLNEGEAGPGPSTAERMIHRALDDEDDNRIVDEDSSAGLIYRKVHSLDQDQDTAMDLGLDDNRFFPFTSELDWRVSRWAIRDGPGNNAFDRLLSIPGLKERLGLSYHNMRSLYQKIDSIPDRAGEWMTRQLVFRDQPEDKYTIRYRDPLEAIKSLWKNPGHARDLVFAPKKVYSDVSWQKCIYSEMWTGKW
ncbi:hypothetical protein BYT27DRAFT_7056438, partial [Phlegmacium glaucopus]